MALAKSQKSLKSWTKQKWRTKSGKPSTQGPRATGERYLPSKAIASLSDKSIEQLLELNAKAGKWVSNLWLNPNGLQKKQEATGK
jgi:hypothetical protein